MKKSILFFPLFFLLFSINLSAEKYALLIGVGNYPENSGWKNLSSENDLTQIEITLKLRGFKANNISKLLHQEATKVNIIAAFKDLKKVVTKKDIVFIHFSGHGQQIIDDSGDEIDGLDEAIVPYDSPMNYKLDVYEGENLIRDDELNKLTKPIRKKTGKKGQVILVLDACHSGTGTRGWGINRGTDIVMGPNSFQKETKIKPETSFGIEDYSTSNDLAPLASFFSVAANEANFETLDDNRQEIGTLSFALAKLLKDQSKVLTFQELFERIKIISKARQPNQNPQWEGPRNRFVFNEKSANESELWYDVKVVNSTQLKASVGTLIGVYRGSLIEVFSLDQQKVISSGLITKAGLVESVVMLSKPLKIRYNELIKVRIKAKAQVLFKTPVHFDISSESRWFSLVNRLKKYKFLQENSQSPELTLATSRANTSQLELTTADGTNLLETIDIHTGSLERKILNQIRNYSQAKILKNYHNPNSKYQFSITLLKNETGEVIMDIQRLQLLKKHQLKVGTDIQIAIKNTGTKAAYFSLLNIQSNNELIPIVPYDEGQSAADFYLAPNQTYLTDFLIGVSEPLGEETLKLICTDKPLDLVNIIQKEGRTTRGMKDLHPFERILQASFLQENTRGNNSYIVDLEEVGTSTLFFRIEQ